MCIFLIFALAASYAAELDGAESSVAAKTPEKRGIYGFGYGHGIGYGSAYGGHGYYGGHGFGHAYPSYGYASVHAAPLIGHGHGFYPYHGHGFYH